MTGIRRALILSGLTVAVVVGGSIPASATFADSVSVATTAVTDTVQAPGNLRVTDTCTTTTITTKRVVRTNPATGAQTTVSTSTTTTTNTATSNVDSESTTSSPGPGAHETTYTTVRKDTDLTVTLQWGRSNSRDVTGYAISAHLGAYGVDEELLTTTATSVTRTQDADMLYLRPSLFVTTLTSYGWTAASATTRELAC
jgi:hypothetical protein